MPVCLCHANWLTLSKIKIMNVAELKNNIHRLVVETDDPVILLEVDAFFNGLSSNSNGHEFNIPQWQIEENRKRVKAYQENPDIAVDFKTAMQSIKEKS